MKLQIFQLKIIDISLSYYLEFWVWSPWWKRCGSPKLYPNFQSYFL